ncbi:thiamine phosphate synthase [Desulforhopalus sp. IMCC35007]|uniref:thiamine phosphate synthase n=1 Tax=Desulforhopalus sp. IMCC35007 TaxID=2569543 RepID=UPI0010AE5DE4|nr:thiamine phosphate synthase [Desulforhopalus sp. IMCC35007]TKB12349.1 thiamine phosphate synthase [Desulforhopalus sp. IMCC35007]
MLDKKVSPKRPLQEGIYGITAECFSKGRSNLQVVEEMIRGGVTTVQYREKKHKKHVGEMLVECQQIRELTRKHGVTFIINDHVDLALLVDADGVHVGQEDLPVAAVRQLIGDDKIIGLSTHSPEQARQAVTAGADYIGVGPIFTTNTKEDVCDAVGLEYLEYVAAQSPLPFVAIGGIKEHNMEDVVDRGAKTICLVTEIVASDDIYSTVMKLRSYLP